MRRIRKLFLGIGIFIAGVLLLTAGSGYWAITASHPQISGTLSLKGLRARVEIVRDPLGVPHIYAANVNDLFFAQGYVQAQDRLWQMEYNRRIGHGTLSDIFGAATIKQDRFLRTLGLGRSARADIAAMDADAKHTLQMYANGVNAFINTHRNNLPLEFTILGFKPAPWEPVDTVAWGKVMAYNLGGNYDTELLRALLIEKLGAAQAQELLPPYPATGPFTIPPEAKTYRSQIPNAPAEIQMPRLGAVDLAAIAELDATLGLRGDGVGSNNWVIDGAKSATGKPILANDPHLGIQMPSIWYAVGLHCVPVSATCPYNVAGFTFPGVPGVVIGRNERIAWGVTNAAPDVQDFFVEELNPQNPNQYKFAGTWQDLQVVEEPIKVKGVVSETLKVQITRHGPIMTPVISATQPLALQWTALRERSRLFESVLALDRAQTWDEFRTALRLWDAPAQNFVYADVAGNIGYQLPGNIPLRVKGNGTVPVPGSGEYEWAGYIPFDELPFVVNPPTHMIASANQQIVPNTYKYLITQDWGAPYRQQRIVDLLQTKDKLSLDDIQAIQGDVYSLPLVTLQRWIVALQPEGFLQQRALEQVKNWDGRLTTENVGGTIVEATYQRLLANLFAEKLGAAYVTYRGASDSHRRAVLALLDQPTSAWWNEAGRDALVQKSFAEGVDWLGSQFGDAPGDWKWGRLHTATFAHPLSSVPPLDRLFSAGPVAAPGGVNTVFTTSFKIGGRTYDAVHITSMRMIIDLGNFANSQHINTTGQSGQPLHKHYSDLVSAWRDVRYAPLYFERAALDRAQEGTLTLLPQVE